MTTLLTLIFVSIILPIWLVLHYLTKWRTTRALSHNERELLESLWRSANKIEERVDVLETLLDQPSQPRRNV